MSRFISRQAVSAREMAPRPTSPWKKSGLYLSMGGCKEDAETKKQIRHVYIQTCRGRCPGGAEDMVWSEGIPRQVWDHPHHRQPFHRAVQEVVLVGGCDGADRLVGICR